MSEYRSCVLCWRKCNADRENGEVGYCKMPSSIYVSRAALHMWEEPIISGTRGSGTIFFDGCSLGCIFCQNSEISRNKHGREISVEQLSEIMLELQSKGAHNINFVTPTHYLPSVREGIIKAKMNGLSIPIVYNTGGYDTPEAIRTLFGLVDVFIPDFKYYKKKSAKEYSNAENYPECVRLTIDEMVTQVPRAQINEEGIMQSGVLVRVLLLPSHLAEAKLTVKYLYETYGDSIYISLMSQYTPPSNMPQPLNRRVTSAEYDELVDYASRLGVKNCFIQEKGSAAEHFIPDFNSL